MTTIGIVCGYDDFDSLEAYVAMLRPVIAEAKPDALILTGGCTSPLCDDSEASVMAALMRGAGIAVPQLLEEEAMSTLENLVNARRIARETFDDPRYVVFCGRTHRLKAATLARLILGRNVRVVAVARRVRLLVRLLEPPTLVFESLAALIPPLRRFVRAGAMWWRGVSVPPRRSAPRAAS
jgi:hypothetical protein